jgi:hypothetical protein
MFPPENRFHPAGCILPATGFVSGIVPVWQGNGHTPASAFGAAAAEAGGTAGKMIKASAIVNLIYPKVASPTDALDKQSD